jgi:hypothetical protein
MYSYGIGLKGALVSFLMAPTGVVTLWIDTIDEAGNRSCSSNYIVVGY